MARAALLGVLAVFHLTEAASQFVPYSLDNVDSNDAADISSEVLDKLQSSSEFLPPTTHFAVRKKVASTRRRDEHCTDDVLRKIMHENMSGRMTEAKHAIHASTVRALEGSWSVVCAPCAFSYLAHTQDYCVHTRQNITCLLYRDN